MKFILMMVLLLMLSGCSSNLKNSSTQVASIPNGQVYNTTDSLKSNGPLTTNLCPSEGNVKFLTFVVSFDDKDYTKVLADTNLAFNGVGLTNGYYSVNSYYMTSSYNKLNITSDIYGVYQAKFSANYYEAFQGEEFGSDVLIKEILNHYDKEIDYAQYDSDEDGYIDGIWLIYTHPVDFTTGDFWWAYTSVNPLDVTYDGKGVSNYAFGGSDFMYDKENVSYDASNIVVDAHTYIHETGHMLGLDDYYDTNPNVGSRCSLYGIDMMDETCGDHGPISKLLLGWINPIVVNADLEYTLRPFETSGDVLLVNKEFKGSLYESYYLIINYGNLEINFVDNPLKDSGLIIYEVNAEQNLFGKNVIYNGGSYDTGFKYDNSDTALPFVDIVTKNKTKLFNSQSESNILFKKGDTLSKSSVDFNLDVLYNNSSNLTVKIWF